MAKARRLRKRGVWRYAVERLDREEDVVRLEIVPLSSESSVEYFLEELVDEEIEQLFWWDTDRSESLVLSVSGCKKELRMGKEQEFTEGMVFWVVKEDGEKRRVIHATQAARKLAAKMYSNLISPDRETGSTDHLGNSSISKE